MHIDVTLKPGVWIDPAAYFKQVSNAGYEARRDDFRLTLVGKVSKEGDRLFFTVEDVKPGPQKFELVRKNSKIQKEAEDWAKAYSELSDKVDQSVEIVAIWKSADLKKDKAGLASLAPIKVNTVKPDGKSETVPIK